MASSYINVQHTYFSAFYKGRKLLLSISNVGNLWFAQANRVNSQIRVFHANKSSALRQGYAQGTAGISQKDKRSVQATKYQRAVSHLHHGPTADLWGRTCKHGPTAGTPHRGALLSEGINIDLGDGVVEEAHFLQIQKVMRVEGQWYVGSRITHTIFRGKIFKFKLKNSWRMFLSTLNRTLL